MSAVMGLSEEAMLQLILYRLSMSYIVSTVNSVCVGCCERRRQRCELFAIVTLSVLLLPSGAYVIASSAT
jgi:hypothetical protein